MWFTKMAVKNENIFAKMCKFICHKQHGRNKNLFCWLGKLKRSPPCLTLFRGAAYLLSKTNGKVMNES